MRDNKRNRISWIIIGVIIGFFFVGIYDTFAFTEYVSSPPNALTTTYVSDGITPVYIQAKTRFISTADDQDLFTNLRADGVIIDQNQITLKQTGDMGMANLFYYGVLPAGTSTIDFSGGGTRNGLSDIFVTDTIGNVETLNFDGFWIFFSFLIFVIGFILMSKAFLRK